MKLTKAEFQNMIAATVKQSLAAYEEQRKATDTALLERVVAIEKRGPSMVPPPDGDELDPPPRSDGGEEDVIETPQGKVKFPRVQIKNPREISHEEFSFVRMTNAIRTGNWKDAPFERHAIDLGEKRAQTLGTGSAGGYLVPTLFLPQEFVDILRAAEVVKPRCEVWSGLVGSPVKVPKQTAEGSMSWITEDADIPESDDTFGEISMTPKIGCARTRITNLLLRNNPVLAETRIRTSLGRKIALSTDLALLRGTGSGGQPTGIASTSGINTVAIGTNGGPITLALLRQMVYECALDNAVFANPCWFMHSRTKNFIGGLLDTTNRPLIQPDVTKKDADMLLGFPVYVSNQIPINLTKGTGTNLAEIYLCADVKELVLGEWDAVEFDVTKEGGDNWKKWSTEVRAITLLDVATKHPVSFCLINDTTS